MQLEEITPRLKYIFRVSDRTIGRAVDSRIGENLITMRQLLTLLKTASAF
jgi:hypothetical protein